MKKLLTFFLTALLAFSVGWAETTTVTASKITSSSASWTGSGNETWTVNVDGGATNQNVTNGYAQVGTRSDPSTSMSFSTSGVTGTITSIVVNCAAYGGNATLNATVGGNAFGNQGQSVPSWSSNTGGNVTFTGSASGAIVITMTNGTGGRAMYIKSITVTYESSANNVATIAEALALTPGNNSNFTFTGDAVVTAYDGGYYMWLRDNTGSGVIYFQNNAPAASDFPVGTVLSRNWEATRLDYNGLKQFRATDATLSTYTPSGSTQTVEPFERTTLTSANMSEYVIVNELTITGSSTVSNKTQYTTAEGITLYDYFNNGYNLTTGKKYNVTGVVSYNTSTTPNIRLYITNVEEVVSTEPFLQASPQSMTISDSGTGNTFSVEGSNLGTDNVGVTQTNNNFTPTLSVTTGTTYSGSNYQGFTPAGGEVNGTVAMSYTGRELSASNTVTLGNNLTSATVTVNYIADLYIVTDNGVTGDWHFDGTCGVPMTYNNGIYSAAFTVNNPNTYILFARKTGEGVTWNTRYVFGPNSSGDWDLPSSGNGGGRIDLNDDDPIKIQGTGTYIITIDANEGTFTIVKKVIGADDFILVESTNDITANDDYVLVYDEAYAMGTTLSNSNGGYYNDVTSGFTVANDVVSLSEGYTVNVFTLLDAGNGKFFMQSENGNYIGVSGNNLIQSTSTPTADTYKWSITISNNSAVIQNASTNRYLAYNTTSPRYNTYQSITTNSAQQYASLYKRGTTQPRITVDPSSLDFVIPAGGTSQEKTVTVTETNTTGTTSVSITGTGAANYSPTLENGTLTVTYNGTATQANPDVATITLTNGEATADVAVTGYKLPITVTITPASSTFSGSTMSGITLESNVTGATLEYRVDGGQWMTYSEAFAVTAATVGQTVTVEARATYNGETSEIATATYQRVAKSNTLFEKVTNSNQLKEDNKYILVYEDGPAAMYNWGYAEDGVQWHGTNVIDIAGTQTSVFTMSGTANAASFSLTENNQQIYLSRSSRQTNPSSTEVTFQITNEGQDGYYLKDGSYIMRYNSQAGDPFRWYDTSTGKVVFLYVQGGMIQAPEITPATGTYYEDQTVTISDESDDVTIWYTTDGSDPATSATRIRYNGQFTAPYAAGTETTIIAVAIDEEDNVSEPATVTYTWGVPTVTIAPATSNVATDEVTVAITGTPAGATIYYTTDGNTPTTESTQYNGAFPVELLNIGDEVTVKAIAVYNGVTSEVAIATYTRVDKVIDVNAPFFSPLQNQTYYGDQTLQMGCTTPNADIHYEIIEVSGEEAPNAAYVNNPNNVSTVYTQPINMTVGHSYYVKAIAYIGSFASTVSEGWYVIKPFQGGNHVYQNLKDFNDNCPTGVTATFANPVQVVYHSTYTNNGEFAEYCYLRDNTDYACVYFGKRDTHDYTIFKMGDWIDGSQIAGVTNIWERNFHIQLGTGGHEVTSWPTSTLGWSEILPEEITNATIVAGTADGSNSWGHYVHLRNTTLRNVQDYGDDDPKHTGLINDGTVDAYYYDKFYRWSAGTCSYSGHNDVIHHLGDYDQAFFTAKQNAGATFDVYGIVDYYSGYNPPFEICPIDFLWIYKPVITVPSNDQCTAPFTTTITVTQPEWTDIAPTIYYKTNEMEDWEEYTPGQLISISSTTTVMTYAEVPAQKTDGTNYNDYLRSLADTAVYVFPAVKEPIITPEGETFDVNVTSSVDVTVQTNPESSTGTVTYYTLDGSDPRTSETRIELTSDNGTFNVSENTTVNAASCLDLNGNTIWSNVVSETYQFIENDNKVYDLLKTAPVVGNIYVIVNKADNVGLSTTQNATNRAATGVMFVDNTKEQVKGNTHLATFVLEAATAGRYYFRGLNTNDYLCVNTNANPNLVTDARSSYAEATVTVNSGITSGVDESYPATVMMSYDGTRRYMRYYSAGRTFTTYDAATTNQDIFLYGLAPAELLPPTITPGDQLIPVVTGDEHVDATIATNPTSAQDGAKTVYTTDGSDPRTSSTAVEMDGNEEILGYINTNTTVRAASYIEYEGDVIWSEPVKATYTFIGIKEPTITPAGGLYVDGTTVNVTVTTNPQNTQEGVQTYYTTDGSDPRSNGTLINGNSTTLPVTGNTTVQAASCVVVDGQTLWSIVVSETYRFTQPIDLNVIESIGVENDDYIVADELIGTWAVYNGNTKLLWAKDTKPSIRLRPGKTDNQGDYVRDLLKYQNEAWDESNWVVLDFSGVSMSPEDFVGQKIKEASIVGKYTDAENYTIKLFQNPTPNGAVNGKNYTGWTENFEPVGKNYDRSYNTYVPANFMAEGDTVNNLNRIDDVTKFVVGAVAGDFALAGCQGDSIYFVNPKIQEVARIWGVWNGNDQFTIYKVGRDTVDSKVTNINAWDLIGCFNVVWDYNRVDLAYDYHKPSHLVPGEAYEFHAAIRKPAGANGSKRTKPVPDGDINPSINYELYPLDMSEDPVPTAVRETLMPKTVIGVTYFNLMGQESSHPYEGINIVVTRYSDGSTSAVKIMR